MPRARTRAVREILEGSGNPVPSKGTPNPPFVYWVWMVARFAPAHQPPQFGKPVPKLAEVEFAVKRRYPLVAGLVVEKSGLDSLVTEAEKTTAVA